MKSLTPILLALVALSTTGCLTTLRTITAEQWDRDGRAQYYLGYWEGNCLGVGMCFGTKGKLMKCNVRDDNSLECSEQQSVTEALEAKD